MHYAAFGCLAVAGVLALIGLVPFLVVISGLVDAIFSVMF